ncbi:MULTISPECIES: chaperone NapD [unclassified Rhizobium]|uniref:chaperone NapD n=1 Tax=unclassified Rhizobium TaxID=2613769 RepID=UPI002157DCED|nr:chaperone NapD [Rhizobium sp. TH2]UVC10434.1 chaperone NapD [Rhizobium sp. TH2]
MSDARDFWHVSSAIVMAHPDRAAAVAETIDLLPGVEVHAVGGSKIVVVIEGDCLGALGDTLIEISAMAGVLSANMVFEQAIQQEIAT